MSEEDLRFVERCRESLKWDEELYKNIQGKRPDAKYGAVSEFVRHAIKDTTQCALFCGGVKCKYDNPDHWRSEQMVINGLFSNWITDNILAIARPSNKVIEQYDIIEQFKEAGVQSIINLQIPGEHAHCGQPLDPSGFSYSPQTFMDHDIFFYNFGWPDYGVGSLSNILDMVKVMQFALTEGKIAVHCHAGLGRTGVLIGAYLVYANRMNPHEAIHYIRSKREGAIQTRNQVAILEEFGAYLKPLRIVFSSIEKETYDFTLPQYMVRQKHMLHGLEAKNLRYIPKLVFVVCERLMELTQRRSHRKHYQRNSIKVMQETAPAAFLSFRRSASPDNPVGLRASHSTSRLHPAHSVDSNHSITNQVPTISASRSMDNMATSFNRLTSSPRDLRNNSTMNSVSDSDNSLSRDSADFSSSIYDTRDARALKAGNAETVAIAMATAEYNDDVHDRVEALKDELNSDLRSWQRLGEESDTLVLSKLMWDWLDHLKEPVLTAQDLPQMLRYTENPPEGLQTLDRITRTTVEYLLGVLTRLHPLSENTEMEVLQRVLSTLTHQNICAEISVNSSIASNISRRTTNTGEMGSNTVWRMMQFFVRYLALSRETQDSANTSRGTDDSFENDTESRQGPIGGQRSAREPVDNERYSRDMSGRGRSIPESNRSSRPQVGERNNPLDTVDGQKSTWEPISGQRTVSGEAEQNSDEEQGDNSESFNRRKSKNKKKRKTRLRSRSQQDQWEPSRLNDHSDDDDR